MTPRDFYRKIIVIIIITIIIFVIIILVRHGQFKTHFRNIQIYKNDITKMSRTLSQLRLSSFSYYTKIIPHRIPRQDRAH